jgi:hypothetical protein
MPPQVYFQTGFGIKSPHGGWEYESTDLAGFVDRLDEVNM